MEGTDIRKIFDTALDLKKGKRALVSFESERAAECARVQFYAEKRKYFKSSKFDQEELTFSRKYDREKEEFFLIIEKVTRGFNFFIEDSPGQFIAKDINTVSLGEDIRVENMQTFNEENIEEETIEEEEAVNEDLQELFEQGKNEEEIDAFLSERYPHLRNGGWKKYLPPKEEE